MHNHRTTDPIRAAQIRVRMSCCLREQPDAADVEFLRSHGALTDELAEMISFVP